MYCQLFSVAAIVTCAVSSPTIKPNDISHSDVDEAIVQITTELIDRFDQHSGWESEDDDSGWLSKSVGGKTSVATLALLSANQSRRSPIINTALEQLKSIRSPSTYVCALRTMIWCELSPTHEKQLKRDVKRLIATLGRQSGGWGYDQFPPRTTDDCSPKIRMFGTTALLEAHRQGITVPSACFGSIAQGVLQTQHSNGGWSHTRGKPTANSTVAGFNCLLGVDEVLGDKFSISQRRTINDALQSALGWLNKHYSPKHNPGGTAMMSYLCSLERATMSCGLDQLRKKDWYREGVAAVLKAHRGAKRAKGSTVNLSFALLFLTRGRVPLSLVELRKDKTTIDPNRLSRKISASVSNQIEQALGWRVVTIIDNIDRWLQAPLLLIQDPEAIPKKINALQEYLDRGGLLVLIGDKKNAKQFKDLANSLCPDIEHRTLKSEHWGQNLVQKANGALIESWNDGIRDRVILLRSSAKMLSKKKPSQQSKALVNICCGAAELSHWKTRLWNKEITLDPKSLFLASHTGAWDAESYGLELLGVKSKLLTNNSKRAVVLVGGISAEEATEKLASDVISEAKTGSIVIVEPIGGLCDFATALRSIIGAQLSILIEPDLDLLETIQPIGFRGFTQFKRKQIDLPLVANVGSGHIIFLDGDIRNALLGHPSWEVHGYDTHTSVALLNALSERIK